MKLRWEKTRPWNTTRRGSSGICMPHSTSRVSLCDVLYSHFYLDTPQNARKNDMSATSRHEDAIVKRFVEPTLSDDIYEECHQL